MRGLVVASAGAVIASLAVGMWISNRSQAASYVIPEPGITSATPSIHVGIQPVVGEAPAPVYATRTPQLLPACVGDRDGFFNVECNGKHGFPAISLDGKTMVDAVRTDDGERGNVGLSVVYLDAKTAKHLRSVIIMSPGELTDQLSDRERTTITSDVMRRARAVQREVDAIGYRSMEVIAEIPVEDTRLHASWDHHTLSVIHTTSNKEIGRHTFVVDVPTAGKYCAYDLSRIEAWWDPVTRLGFGRQYFTSGDFCDSPTVDQVFRL